MVDLDNGEGGPMLDYAYRHRERYLDWCAEVEASPYTALDKAELAIISAHCGMDAAIDGFETTRHAYGRRELAQTLMQAGVFAPGIKAARIIQLRRRVNAGEPVLPVTPSFKPWREHVKITGLGYCKASFAAALVKPLESDVVCLDTHVLRYYAAKPEPTYRKLERYEAVEQKLVREANEVGLPPFPYQWALWDYQRLQRHQAPNDHSFLWRGGRRQYQVKLFT